MITEAITSIRRHAEQIGRDLAAVDAAGAAVLAEKAILLREVVTALGPALRALSSPVSVAGIASANGVTTDPAGWRGVVITGDGPKSDKGEWVDFAPGASGKRGRYGGARLILRQDGAFVELAYDGPWSTVPGEVSRWVAEVRVLSDVEVAKVYGLDDILTAIGEAVEKHVQSHKKSSGLERRALKLDELAERIRALRTLLRTWTP